jgi:hypothetical protein
MDLTGSWEYIIRTARSRLEHNKTEHHIDLYDDQIEIIGVAGEITARRFLGLSEEVHIERDGGVDLFYNHQRVDVKATLLTPATDHRYLQWPKWRTIAADIILMTAVDPIHMSSTVLGYATRKEMRSAPVNTKRQIPCHEIAVVDLHPAYELIIRRTASYGKGTIRVHHIIVSVEEQVIDFG